MRNVDSRPQVNNQINKVIHENLSKLGEKQRPSYIKGSHLLF
jgi:hypothetical protein